MAATSALLLPRIGLDLLVSRGEGLWVMLAGPDWIRHFLAFCARQWPRWLGVGRTGGATSNGAEWHGACAQQSLTRESLKESSSSKQLRIGAVAFLKGCPS